jgi:uncharacterized delta-60 repeat protein
VTLRHPPAIIAAGTIDENFPEIVRTPTNQLVELALTTDFIYLQRLDNSAVITRLRRDGTEDPNYRLDFYASSALNLPDDRLLLIGYGYPPMRLLRADGSIDETFQPDVPAASQITSATVATDGKMIVAGTIATGSYSDGIAYVKRLLPSGAVDPSFAAVTVRAATLVNPNPYIGVVDIKEQPDGRILIGGLFAEVNGARRVGLARLMPDGQLDASFEPPGSFYVRRLAALSNGEIYVGGYFPGSIMRLNADGSLDDTFELPPNSGGAGWSHIFSLDAKERLYVVSESTASPAAIIRILPNGEVDPSFTADIPAWAVYPTRDGLYVLGPFDWSGTHRQMITRLHTDPPTMLRAPEILEGGRIAHTFNFPANTPYVLEETGDFGSWVEVQSGVTADGYVRLETAAPIGTRFYRVRSQQ